MSGDDDNDSIATPTQSELNTFKVLANLDFADLTKPEPHNFHSKERIPEDASRDDKSSVRSEAKSQAQILSLPPSRRPSVTSTISIHEEGDFVPAVSDPEPKSASSNNAFYATAKIEADAEVAIEKESLLYEIELMEKQGLIKLHRQLSMEHTLEEIQYQYDRANMIVSTQQTVDWAKTGIRMGSSILETLLKRFGVSIVDGFSTNLCKDMNRFNKPLTKMYRKYWRRGSSSPEMELAMIVFGALAMTIMANKGFLGGGNSSASANTVQAPKVDVKPSNEPPSTLKPPSLSSFGMMQSSPPVQAPQKPALPEWAKAAINAPVATPTHYAQVVPTQASNPTDMFPEENFKVATPIPPVAAIQSTLSNIGQSSVQPQGNVASQPSQQENQQDTTKKLILTSPKSLRRRKEAPAELNLDI